MRTLAQKIDSFSLAALIVAMCSQLDVRRIGRDTLAEGLGYATKTLAVALSDVVFLLVVLWFIMRCIQTQSWKKLWWPPLPCFALIFALVLAAFHAGPLINAVSASLASNGPKGFITKESKEAIAEIIQWTGYFLVAPWVFVNLIHDNRGREWISRRRLALVAFCAMAVLLFLIGFFQTLTFTQTAPRASFGSPNVYAAFAALAVPFMVARFLGQKSGSTVLFTLAAVAILVLVPTTLGSIWALAAMLVGLLAFAVLRPHLVGYGAMTIILVCFFVPGALGSTRDARQEFLQIHSKDQQVKKQYIEWQVATRWNSPREKAFATGFGPGNYQLNIGPLYQYDSVPNEEKMPPDSNNLWLVQAASIGILGLGALLWVVGHFMGLAWQAAKKWPHDWLGAGVLASLVAWFCVNFFHALIVRGAGLVLAFLFALAFIAMQGERNENAWEASKPHE